MTTFGDTILYASIAVGAVALTGLILKELKNIYPTMFGSSYLDNLSDHVSRLVSPLIYITAGLLAFAYTLITYYFASGNYAYEYVWKYSSSDLPLIYKISGVWAGQPGTYLMWALVIFLAAAWLTKTTRLSTPLARRTQIVTLAIGIYFIILTVVMSPFATWLEFFKQQALAYGVPLENVIRFYEQQYNMAFSLEEGFVDGSGLTALLVNFWMIVHPPVLFIGYATMTIPFAAAMVYLVTKEDGWEELSRQWARFTWLFLGLGIAVGGLWAYLVLGWGGFWAWDPVETASLVPWLALTGFLHAAALHRKNKKTFSIAAPMLAAASFALVLYAAVVVRSGLFNSVHAFGDTSTGSLLVLLILITVLVSLALGLWRYLSEPDREDGARGFLNKTNLFYITLLLFVVLTFVSFWGITFPVIIQLTQGVKVGVASDTKNFFNVWSYPFTIVLLLALGFCLNYRESEKVKQMRTLLIVAAITVITMFARTENFYVLNHNSPFFVSEPFAYKMIGSISLLSMFPPLVYVAASLYTYLSGYLGITSLRPKLKGIGLSAVHLGVVFILFGAVISSTFTQSMEANVPLAARGQIVDVGNGYSVKILDVSEGSLVEKSYPGTPIARVVADPASYEGKTVKISGMVTDLNSLEGHGTLVKLTDTSGSMWVIFEGNVTVPKDTGLTVTGRIMSGFELPVLNPSSVDEFAASGQYRVQKINLEVYSKNKKIGSGTAEYLEGKGEGTFPLVDPDLKGTDVYVIFQGMSGNIVPLTLKIIPAINFTWIGVILFAAGIILIMAVRAMKGS